MEMTLIVVSVVSLLVAAVMSVVAWRLLRIERRRSSARVAALAAEIQDVPFDAAANFPAREVVDDFVLRDTSEKAPSEMFTSAPQRSRWQIAASAALFIVGVVAAALLLTSEGGGSAGTPAAAGGEAATAVRASERPSRPAAAAPLELVALGHERDADGLTVRGVLRNPAAGAELSHLNAVVLVFNRDGRSVATGRAPVQAATLVPGGETTFVVTVSGAPDVERYRVSFRTEQDVVPHVDRRS
jgi:hypothetical protein